MTSGITSTGGNRYSCRSSSLFTCEGVHTPKYVMVWWALFLFTGFTENLIKALLYECRGDPSEW